MLRLALPTVLAALAALPALAQTPPARTPTISVSGEGHAAVAPDIARLRIAVVTEAKTAREALADNAKRMTAVLDLLRAEGLAPRDLQTDGLSVVPRTYDPRASSDARRIVGYSVTNGVAATVRDIAKLGALVDKVVESGANQLSSLEFDVADKSAALDKARAAAVAEALRKADIIAAAAGGKRGRILSISESGAEPLRPIRMMRAEAASATPIAPGEAQLAVTVEVRVALE